MYPNKNFMKQKSLLSNLFFQNSLFLFFVLLLSFQLKAQSVSGQLFNNPIPENETADQDGTRYRLSNEVTNLNTVVNFTGIGAEKALRSESGIPETVHTDNDRLNRFRNINLLDFAAKFDMNQVSLTWSADQERPFSRFVVERSIDGKNFNVVGIVFSNEVTDSNKDYAFADANLKSKSELLYYRLRMIDVNKNTFFTTVHAIHLGQKKTILKLTSYPIPVVQDLRVTIPVAWQGKEVRFEFMNGYGWPVKIQKSMNARQTEVIPLTDLGKGVYFIQAYCGNEMAQQRILKK